MPRKIATPWSHQEVSTLSRLHALHPDDWPLHAKFERHTPTEVKAKLVELGLVDKPVKPALDDVQAEIVSAAFADFLVWQEPQRTLAIRAAIAQLQALLPKREPKAVAE